MSINIFGINDLKERNKELFLELEETKAKLEVERQKVKDLEYDKWELLEEVSHIKDIKLPKLDLNYELLKKENKKLKTMLTKNKINWRK